MIRIDRNPIAGTTTAVDAPLSMPNRTRAFRPGFSFTEILFAVMVLGIGFIMIAAIFPVAIKQTQATGAETNAATTAKEAVSYLAPQSALMSLADNVVHAIVPTDPVGQKIAGTMILPSDPRYAWVAMYRRGFNNDDAHTPAQFAQVIVIAVQAHNRTIYDSNDLVLRGTSPATLQARPLTAKIHYMTNVADQITFTDIGGNIGAVGEGTYVVVADDGTGEVPASTNGFIYRVGNYVSGNTWELSPGNDTTGSAYKPADNAPFSCLVVGRGYDDAAATTYSGPAQDAAVYTTFITP